MLLRDSFQRVPRLFHSSAMTRQQRSLAAFSRLGDSAVTNRRSVASICGRRGFKSWQQRLRETGIQHDGEMLQCAATRANRAKSIAAKEPPRLENCSHPLRARIAEGDGSHIIRSLAGCARAPLKRLRRREHE